MKRSPIWIAAYVQAWRELRGLRVFPPGPPLSGSIDRGEPMAPDEIARRCAATADECEAGFVAAFGPIEDGAVIDVLREAISDLLNAHGPVVAERRDTAGAPIFTAEQNALRRLRRLITTDA